MIEAILMKLEELNRTKIETMDMALDVEFFLTGGFEVNFELKGEDLSDGARKVSAEDLIGKMKKFIQYFEERVIPVNKCQQVVKVFAAHNIVTYSRGRARAYRSAARSAFSAASSDDDGGDGESSDPPARPYYYLSAVNPFRIKTNRFTLTVESPRKMSLCLTSERREAP